MGLKDEVHDLAYSVVWPEFNSYYANAECDYLTERLARKLVTVIEDFVEAEHDRRLRLQADNQREVEVRVYGQ